MLAINNLCLQYGDKRLFDQVSVRLTPGDRIGLVGVNGAGKSTLMKILAGVQECDDGVVSRGRRTTIGYLPQEAAGLPEGRSVYQQAETAFAELLALQGELDQIHQRLATLPPDHPEAEPLLTRQGELQLALEGRDVFRIRPRIEKVLLGLGFHEADFDKPCARLSGGWAMRLMLARLLLTGPDLLLLDEPTNHLDLESLTWLEDFLKGYAGAMVIISHDRAFLDNLATSIWELSLGKLTIYRGNYSRYLVDKEERRKIQQAAYENQQAKIQQTMRFVERFRAKSTKASQVQSRLRQLEKMERIELDQDEKQVRFRFPPAPASGRLMLAVEGLGKRFGDQEVLREVSFTLERGDKLAVVGVNGAGKSTLVKTLAGLHQPDSGRVRPGHQVRISYFGQHQARELDPRLSVFDTVYQAGGDLTVTQVRSLLGAFLFRGDEVEKKVAVLSGGEKSRLALAKMIAAPANLLILDEPTNHLDIVSQQVLQEALRQYDGGVILVSHNRAFANGFVNQVLAIRHGRASLFLGTIDDYLAKTRAGAADRQADKQAPAARPAGPQARKGKQARQLLARLRQEKQQQLGPLQKKLAQAEKEVERLERSKKELETLLADPELYQDQQRFLEKSREYQAVEHRLERALQTWERLQEKLETAEAAFASRQGEMNLA